MIHISWAGSSATGLAKGEQSSLSLILPFLVEVSGLPCRGALVAATGGTLTIGEWPDQLQQPADLEAEGMR
jgi:hypothetical protein